MMTVQEIGCCGAYCRTCKVFSIGQCKGCKLGYGSRERDINKARCKIKLCCFKEHQLQTCMDCDDYHTCELIQSWFQKGYEYRYQKSLEFIKEHGYEKFMEIANEWDDAKGKL